LLDIIEAVDGPLKSDLMLSDHAPRDKFAAKATRTSDNAYAQARNVLKAVKLADLI
jgi:DNA-binding IscR family transcriptional regulator